MWDYTNITDHKCPVHEHECPIMPRVSEIKVSSNFLENSMTAYSASVCVLWSPVLHKEGMH